jgi:hypothetical protein
MMLLAISTVAIVAIAAARRHPSASVRLSLKSVALGLRQLS